MHTKEVTEKLKALSGRIMECAETSRGINLSNAGAIDFLIISALNRGMNLLSGFCLLIERRNVHSAAPLVRLQFDTAMRLFACGQTDNPEQFALDVFNQKQIDKIKSRNGDHLTDRYLAGEIDKIHPGFKDAYKRMCGYVHFSDRHARSMIARKKDNPAMAFVVIATGDKHVRDEEYLEHISLFNSGTNLLLNVAAEFIRARHG